MPATVKDMGGKEPTYFLRARYLQAIQEAGGVPLVLPLVLGRTQHTFLLQTLGWVIGDWKWVRFGPTILWRICSNIPFQKMSEERARLGARSLKIGV